MRSLLARTMIGAALLLSSPNARADDGEGARAAFEAGAKAYAAGDYAQAARAFEDAYAQKPHPSALWNAARARQRMGDLTRAANLYARYLREAPAGTADRDTAIAALSSLSAQLGRIEIHAASGVDAVRLDGAAPEAALVYVSAGEHLVEWTTGDGPSRKTVAVAPGELLSLALAPPPPAAAAGDPRAAGSRTPGERPREPRLPLALLIAGAAATVVLTGITVWSGLDTLAQKDTFDSARTQGNIDEGLARQTRTNVLLGVTAGIGALTGASAIYAFAF